ncbi:hypothetical protein [Parvularcula marina]|uniref:hypothetical protein n=1 Tax=Parvularcula marina TaxID=2292771 RepID=UPI0035112B04
MRPDRFPGLEPRLAGLLLPIARERFTEQVTALAWWRDEARAVGLVLLAFAAEIDSIPEKVSEPTLGAIRYAFWREVLAEIADGRARAHPVAEGLLALSAFNRPPSGAELEALVTAGEDSLPEAEGDVPKDPAALMAALLPLLARTAGAKDDQDAPLAALGRAFVADERDDWQAVWQALTPLPETLAPIAGAARLHYRRAGGKALPAYRQQFSLFLTTLKGR